MQLEGRQRRLTRELFSCDRSSTKALGLRTNIGQVMEVMLVTKVGVGGGVGSMLVVGFVLIEVTHTKPNKFQEKQASMQSQIDALERTVRELQGQRMR